MTAFVRKNPELSGCTLLEFCDDGYSGVNFERPKVKEMLEKVRKNMIQCIIVKDFSRFGRNYIEVGDYIEQVFPFLGVRFVSVNDNYDSNNDYNSIGGIEVALRTLIYDLYSKDLSQKVRSALEIRYKKGEFIGSYTPFGYIKADGGQNKLAVDPEAAKYVRKMFDLAISGVDAYEIARILNADMTPTKAQYKKHKMGYTTWDKRALNIDNSFWTDTYVRKVIQNEVYTGMVIMGKTWRPDLHERRFKQKPKSEWVCVPDMHEPIVSKEEFDLANKMIRVPARKKTVPKEQYLYSKIRCHCCKRSMKRSRSTISPIFTCDTPKFKPSPNCITEPVSEIPNPIYTKTNYRYWIFQYLFFYALIKTMRSPIRAACPNNQGTGSIFSLMCGEKISTLEPLTIRTFAVSLRRRQRGTGIKFPPRCRQLHCTAKTALLPCAAVSLCGGSAPAPPTSYKEQKK